MSKRILPGENIPNGVSVRINSHPMSRYLAFPVWRKKRGDYDINNDTWWFGVWTFRVILEFDWYAHSGGGLRLHYGWMK